MNAAAADQALLQIVNRPGANTIADVVAKIEAINDSLQSNDGLKWFNLLYLNVTQKVDGQPPPDGWKDPSWLVTSPTKVVGQHCRHYTGIRPSRIPAAGRSRK